MMDALAQTGVPDGFALQLCNSLPGSATASKQGNMWIGGYDSSFTAGPMQWVSISGDLYYEVKVNNISVNGVAVSGSTSLNNPPTIVDSGTTLMLLPTVAFNALVSALTESNAIIFDMTQVDENDIANFWAGTEGLEDSTLTLNTSVTISMQGPTGNVNIFQRFWLHQLPGNPFSPHSVL